MTAKSIAFPSVTLDGGFWYDRQQINAETTIRAIYERFVEMGRFEALKFNWKEGDPNRPHVFWDSDVAKWVEAASFVMEKRPQPEWEQVIDECAELMLSHQREDGYYNSYFLHLAPEKIFQERWEHELYTIGHWIEAAVAYHRATGKDRLLLFARRMVDCVEKVFVKEQSAAFATPGHPEIELALVKLYRHTGEERYLALARHFLDKRGTGPEPYYDFALSAYAQDHLPVREQTTAEGHAVRANYLFCGMADVALEDGDEALHAACRTLFENVTQKRMYVTGGTGSSHIGEAFTIDYDLPNRTAYAESCAAIALAMFCLRMRLLEPEKAEYADIVERVLYNGFLSGVSLDGKSFFYENPLAIDLAQINKDNSIVPDRRARSPITQRQEYFDCSCCPPNIARFLASFGDTLYHYTDDRFYVDQYAASTTETQAAGGRMRIVQETEYPKNGKIRIRYESDRAFSLCLRIPAWCNAFTLSLNGDIIEPQVISGYAVLPAAKQAQAVLEFCMDATLWQANPHVAADAGKVAVQRGPVVYCAEGVDNPGPLYSYFLRPDAKFTEEPNTLSPLPALTTTALRREWGAGAPLYRPCTPDVTTAPLRLIPYYCFANRGNSDMQVWLGLTVE
jgi:DUF1680 family protein